MGKKTVVRKKRLFGFGNLNDTVTLEGRKRFKSSEDLLEESVFFANSTAMKSERTRAKEYDLSKKITRSSSFVDQLSTMRTMVESSEFVQSSTRKPILSVLIVKLEEMIVRRGNNLNVFEEICELVRKILKILRNGSIQSFFNCA